jgi:serine/threonine protein kinase
MAIGDGKITIPGVVGIATVQYIIFELAEGDVRVQMDAAQGFDAAWALRTLHQIATGLRQLHGIGAAHQDLKPSNVLLFNGRTSSKVADLGRAAVRGQRPPHEDDVVAGDPAYAPPEVLYGEPPADWAARRMGCDAYHLGSMIVFFFTTGSMTPLLLSFLDRTHWPHQWVGSYQEVLQYIYSAFEKALHEIEQLVPEVERGELMEIVRQLCEPDPSLRGHPKNRLTPGNRYSLERYVAWLNLLATQAEYRMTGGQRGSGVVTV